MKKYTASALLLSLLIAGCSTQVVEAPIDETSELASEDIDTEVGTELSVSGTYSFSEMLDTLVFTVNESESSIVDGHRIFTFTNGNEAKAALEGTSGEATIIIKDLVEYPEGAVDGPGYEATFVTIVNLE